jgi:protein SCO1/2
MASKGRVIASVLGVGLAVLLPLGTVFFFKYKEKDRHIVHFPGYFFPIGFDTIRDENGLKKADTVYHTVPEFNFTAQDGQPFDSRSLKGKLWIANFFYTSCPGICPVMSKQMQVVQEEFLNDDQVKIVSFSTDPERDTVPELKKYSQRQNAIPGKWYFLTGQKEQIQDLARHGFMVTAKESDTGEHNIDHSDKFVLIDDKGRIRGYYNGTDSIQVRELMGDIVLILSRMNK